MTILRVLGFAVLSLAIQVSAKAQIPLRPGQVNITAGSIPGGWGGVVYYVTNKGSETPTQIAYGMRSVYLNLSRGLTLYDVGSAAHSVWQAAPGRPGGQMFGQWVIAESPKDTDNNWGIVGSEINVVNRGLDTGWSWKRGDLKQFSAGVQIVPEANDFGNGGSTKNVNALLVLAPSNGVAASGLRVRAHSSILVEPGTVAPGGSALTISGDVENQGQLGANTPGWIARLAGGWQHGLSTVQANIFDTVAFRMASSQRLGWERSDGQQTASIGSDEAGNLTLVPAGNGAVVLFVNGTPRRVVVGGPDSGGVGFRALVTPN